MQLSRYGRGERAGEGRRTRAGPLHPRARASPSRRTSGAGGPVGATTGCAFADARAELLRGGSTGGERGCIHPPTVRLHATCAYGGNAAAIGTCKPGEVGRTASRAVVPCSAPGGDRACSAPFSRDRICCRTRTGWECARRPRSHGAAAGTGAGCPTCTRSAACRNSRAVARLRCCACGRTLWQRQDPSDNPTPGTAGNRLSPSGV